MTLTIDPVAISDSNAHCTCWRCGCSVLARWTVNNWFIPRRHKCPHGEACTIDKAAGPGYIVRCPRCRKRKERRP